MQNHQPCPIASVIHLEVLALPRIPRGSAQADEELKYSFEFTTQSLHYTRAHATSLPVHPIVTEGFVDTPTPVWQGK